MNKLPIAKRAQIIGLLVEGNSLRATSRLADCAYNTVLKFIADIGAACAAYQDKALNNLPCKRIQCDEIWSFVYAKDKNASDEMKAAGQAGDVWTWTAIDADSKLIAAWMLGDRTYNTAKQFIADLAPRLRNRVQLTTDGHKAYINAVREEFHGEIDYAQLVKVYGIARFTWQGFIPADVVKAEKHRVSGNPDMKQVSTSFVERQNLTMRMGIRRFGRCTNAFSKKMENHGHAVALHFMHYNFARVHKTLRVTPAMEAGISDHVWSLEEIAALIPEPVAVKRGPYKKRNS